MNKELETLVWLNDDLYERDPSLQTKGHMSIALLLLSIHQDNLSNSKTK